jgi:glycosyltransferase involved in cell wall biosynthesis
MLKLNGYDIINVHDFPATALSLRNENTIWYCHTPPRLFYDLKNYELKKVNALLRPFAMLYVTLMQIIDKKLVKKIPIIIANSKNVQMRIKKFYNVDSQVIYPGITIKKNEIRFEKFLLSVSRLFPEKRVDMVVQAMSYLPEYKLYVVGSGPAKEHIEKIIAKNKLNNVFLLGDVSEEKLSGLYRNCFAVIYVPIDEDFGLIPLEANSYGKMVVGAREGGLKETIIHEETGFLIDDPTPIKIAQAIKKLEKVNPKNYVNKCISHAKKFSLINFNKKIEQTFIEFQRVKFHGWG